MCYMPQVSVYLTKNNLAKLDRVKGRAVKRSTAINMVFDYIDEPWLIGLLK